MNPRVPAPLVLTIAALVALLGWDVSNLDMVLAAPLADGHGFFLRDQWILSTLLHDDMRRLAWLPVLWLLIGIGYPTGLLRRIPQVGRVHWALATLLALAAVSWIKHLSPSSCPWDIEQFGGHAHWLSHWAWFTKDGGPGHCFPAGHASAGFAFLPGWFVLRRYVPRAATTYLAGVLATGLVLGLTQQLRGAHFMSHTLWTAWLCWTLGYAVDATVKAWTRSPVAAVGSVEST